MCMYVCLYIRDYAYACVYLFTTIIVSVHGCTNFTHLCMFEKHSASMQVCLLLFNYVRMYVHI